MQMLTLVSKQNNIEIIQKIVFFYFIKIRVNDILKSLSSAVGIATNRSDI